MYTSFADITSSIDTSKIDKVLAIANPVDDHSIQAAILAKEKYGIESILVGNADDINPLLDEFNTNNFDFRVIDIKETSEVGKRIVQLIHDKEADIIMKGHIQTGDLIRPVLDKERGLRESDTLSNVALLDIPKYHKLLAVTDAGLNLEPNFEQRVNIVNNAVSMFHKLGYEKPKVGLLEANEEVNLKMPTSVEAEKIMNLQHDGTITGCVIDGPISTDVALDKESADYKGYSSEVAGDADIVSGANITVNSALIKALITFADTKVAAFIAGATCPIINNSRSTPVDEKVDSILIALAMYGGELNGT